MKKRLICILFLLIVSLPLSSCFSHMSIHQDEQSINLEESNTSIEADNENIDTPAMPVLPADNDFDNTDENAELEYTVYECLKHSSKSVTYYSYYVFHPDDNTVYHYRDNYYDLHKGIYTGSLNNSVTITYEDGIEVTYEIKEDELITTNAFGKELDAYWKVDYEKAYERAIAVLNQYLKNTELSNSYKEQFSEKYDIILFGNYEQDGNPDNGLEPIEWLVLKEENGKAFLLSLYILDFQKFNDPKMVEQVKLYERWGGSTIRKWLNEDFFNQAFSEDEKRHIQTTTLSLTYPYDEHAKNQETVSDKLFLLSSDEVSEYLDGILACAQKTDAFYAMLSRTKNGYYRWLTISEKSLWQWYCVNEIYLSTVSDMDEVGIRPCMWVSSDSVIPIVN